MYDLVGNVREVSGSYVLTLGKIVYRVQSCTHPTVLIISYNNNIRFRHPQFLASIDRLTVLNAIAQMFHKEGKYFILQNGVQLVRLIDETLYQ